MSTTTREHRIVAALASLALSLSALLGLPSTAMAMAGGPTGDITNTPGTIDVYKHVNPGRTLEYGSGNEVSAGGEALDGVPFTLHKVEGVDLANGNTGWDVVRKITGLVKPVEPVLDNQNSPIKVTIDGKKYTLKEIDEKTAIDGTGPAQFTDTYPGLYIVTKSKVSLPLGFVIVAKAVPSFITLSIEDTKGARSYTANVYPKNIVSSKPGKSAEMKSATDGVITWTVEQTLPTSGDTNKLTKFRSEDDSSGAGDTKGIPASVKVTVNGKDKTGDFNKELAGLDGKHLVIMVENSDDLPSGGEIVATYTTKTSGDDQFRNGVPSFTSDVEVGRALTFADPSKITVEKLDATNKAPYLSGAEFKVCVDEGGVEETEDCPVVGTITTEKSLGTGSLDKLKIQRYVLFETVAPTGYTFNPDTPYRVDLTTATYNTVTLAIENMKTSMSTLPLTGADNQLLMAIGDVALILLVGGVFLVTHKKCSEK